MTETKEYQLTISRVSNRVYERYFDTQDEYYYLALILLRNIDLNIS